MSFLTAASERSSSGLSGAVSGACFPGTSSSCGLALMLFAMSLQPALSLHRIAVCRVADSLKGWLRLPKTSSVEESFSPRRKCAGNHYVSPGRFEKPRPCELAIASLLLFDLEIYCRFLAAIVSQ